MSNPDRYRLARRLFAGSGYIVTEQVITTGEPPFATIRLRAPIADRIRMQETAAIFAALAWDVDGYVTAMRFADGDGEVEVAVTIPVAAFAAAGLWESAEVDVHECSKVGRNLPVDDRAALPASAFPSEVRE